MNKWTIAIIIFLISCSTTPHTTQQGKGTKNYSIGVSRYGALSLLAIDMVTNKVIVQHNSQQRMTPASLTKIFTTGAGLTELSGDYRYKTRFYLNKDHNSKTSLVIVGGGDPTLGSDRFEKTKARYIFEKVAEAVMMFEDSPTLDGGIIVDNSCYAGIRLPSKRLREDIGNYYGAVPDGLSYKENTFLMSLQSPKGIGKTCSIVKTEPKVNVDFNCLVKSADNNKDSAYIYGNAAMDQWYVSGTIPQNRKNFTIKGALPQPEVTLAQELITFLKAKGIKVSNNIKKQALLHVHGTNKVIYTHYSPSTQEIVSVINKQSHNLYADHLLFALAQEKCGQANWDTGVKELSEFWNSKVPGFTGVFYDGSGLSPFNAFSASDMVDALMWLNQSDYKQSFKQSLAIAGVDGTLKGFLKESRFQGKFIGKSGSMNGVLGYCGYIQTQDGKELAFCIVANRFTEPFKEIRMNIESLIKEIILQN